MLQTGTEDCVMFILKFICLATVKMSMT